MIDDLVSLEKEGIMAEDVQYVTLPDKVHKITVRANLATGRYQAQIDNNPLTLESQDYVNRLDAFKGAVNLLKEP